jgi:hypothetical protein
MQVLKFFKAAAYDLVLELSDSFQAAGDVLRL